MKNKTTKQTKRLVNGSWKANGSRMESRLFIPLVLIATKYDNTFINREQVPLIDTQKRILKEMQFLEKGLTLPKLTQYLGLIAKGHSAYKGGYNSEPAAMLELDSIRKWAKQNSQ